MSWQSGGGGSAAAAADDDGGSDDDNDDDDNSDNDICPYGAVEFVFKLDYKTQCSQSSTGIHIDSLCIFLMYFCTRFVQ